MYNAQSLSIENLEWSFEPGQEAFLQLQSLNLEAGMSLVLAGPSGCGKSSLLYLLGGLERPTRGSLRWNSTRLETLSEGQRDRWRRENLGMVFQDFRLIPELSVVENILISTSFTHFRPSKEEKNRALELSEHMGLKDPDQKSATLSRGEMQRCALARALFSRPGIILADEPTASLDAENAEKISDLLLKHLKQEKITLIAASHDKQLIKQADAQLFLDHGRPVSEPALGVTAL